MAEFSLCVTSNMLVVGSRLEEKLLLLWSTLAFEGGLGMSAMKCSASWRSIQDTCLHEDRKAQAH